MMMIGKHRFIPFVVKAVLIISVAALTGFGWIASPQVVGKIDAASAAMVTSPVERGKFALLIGVSTYSRGSMKKDLEWWDLHAKGDIEILAEVLIRKFQFKPENIKVLSDQPVMVGGKVIPAVKPTRQAIMDAFRQSLIGKVQDGDIAYMHFSGHGQAVPDDNGDEADGMDETIVPADYVSQADATNNIRDDEIGALLDVLSAKKPSNVTITLDSCFSGTATRGDEVPRGGPWKGKMPKATATMPDDSVGDFLTRGGARGDVASRQNYVFLSAASQEQTAKEMTEADVKYGAFSYALAKTLERAGPKTTYRDLIEQLNDTITANQRDQTPQIEGLHQDKLVLADGALPTQPYLSVRFEDSRIILAAGRLQGVTKGSRYAVYPSGAKEHKDGTQLADVEVDAVSPLVSTLKVIGKVDPAKLRTAVRAFETSHNYDEILRVAVRDDARAADLFKAVFAKDFNLAEKVGDKPGGWNLVIRQPDPNGSETVNNMVKGDFRGWVLERPDGSIAATVAHVDDVTKLSSAIREALKREATWQLVKSFDNTRDPSLDVIKISLVPVKVTIGPTGATEKIEDSGQPLMNERGLLRLHACEVNPQTNRCRPSTGDEVQIEIRNTGTQDVYVTLLNLTADGRIGPAFPYRRPGSPMALDNRIKAGTTYRVPQFFRMREPYGLESFRAIVTATPTDFSPLIDPTLLTRGDGRGERGDNAANSPIGRLLLGASIGKRAEPVSPPPSWATTGITYLIVPRVR